MKHIKGNLLDFPAGINIVVHQANVNQRMGAGIAAQIAKRYPVAVVADDNHWAEGDERLGNFSVAILGSGRKIINLYGQSIQHRSTAGVPTDYNAVVKGFQRLTEYLREFDHEIVVGVPKFMGCALGGGIWSVYESIIDATVGQAFPVVCVEFDMKG